MIVLKIIGWVLLGILALIILAQCVRVRIAMEYSDDNTNVLLQWLFIKIPLYPAEKKEPKQPKPKKEKPKKEKPKKQSGPPDEAEAPPEASAGPAATDEPSAEQPSEDQSEEAFPPVADQSAAAQETVVEAAPPETAPEEAPAEEAPAEEKPADEAPAGENAAEEPAGEAAKPEEAEKQPEEAAKQPEAEKKPAEKKESLLHMIYRTHGVDGILELVRRVFSYLGSYMGDLMGAMVIEELYLDIGCTKKDAAATAIYYGEVCSALFPMLGALAARCKIKKYDINVYPDYLARFSRASFFVKFHFYPIYLVGVTILFGCRMMFRVVLRMLVKTFLHKKDKSAEKQNIKQEEKEDESHEGAVSGRNPVNND